jgi:hypothetical protein
MDAALRVALAAVVDLPKDRKWQADMENLVRQLGPHAEAGER